MYYSIWLLMAFSTIFCHPPSIDFSSTSFAILHRISFDLSGDKLHVSFTIVLYLITGLAALILAFKSDNCCAVNLLRSSSSCVIVNISPISSVSFQYCLFLGCQYLL